MVRVPSDPAQVSVNNPSFRVELGPSSRRRLAGAGGPAAVPVAAGAVGTGGVAGAGGAEGASARTPEQVRRRAPVVWSGKADDTAAGRLLQAVPRDAGAGAGAAADLTATQVLPRVEPTVVGPRGPEPPAGRGQDPDATQMLPRIPDPARPYDAELPDGDGGDVPHDDNPYDDAYYDIPHVGRSAGREPGRGRRRGAEPVRHAYYPDRRMNLGMVLLPLRIILGFISLYAGMGKLSDPLFFDGGDRGSMRTWLTKLEPWAVAEPLYGFALAHPVGAGLTVAFLQVIVGVLTICGLWQRVAAGVGALLSVALLVTVSWRAAPAYEAPDILFLAAWSPLIIAGAPVYSLDARLAGEAWRSLGPRAAIWDLRRRVLRRGTVLAAVIVGLSLLIGSMLGAAVRSSQTVRVPGPDEPPVNHLPGSPLPSPPGGTARGGDAGSASPGEGRGSAPGSTAPSPGASSAPGSSGPAAESGSTDAEQPTAPQEPQAPPPPAEDRPAAPPSTQDDGTADSGGSAPASGPGSGGGGSDGGSGSGSGEDKPGLVGGLLG